MSAFRKLFRDRIALSVAAIGVVLMVFTILTRVNPVEGSVVRPQWLLSVGARPLHLTLLGSCLPAMIVCFYIGGVMEQLHLTFPGAENFGYGPGVMLAMQAALYFGIGRLISLAWRRRRRRTKESEGGP